MNPTHYTLTKTVLYHQPDKQHISAYLPRNTCLIILNQDVINNLIYVQTETHRSGYINPAILEPYNEVFPTAPILRWPADPGIELAEKAGRPSQQIDLENIGIPLVHRRLSGPMCCAAVAGIDVLPLLNTWKSTSPSAEDAAQARRLFYALDLIDLLSLSGITAQRITIPNPSPSELFHASPAIVACRMSAGKINRSASISHWIVALRVLPSAATAFVRIYNPYYNQEESILFDELLSNSHLDIITFTKGKLTP
jgi:hypothetical protein